MSSDSNSMAGPAAAQSTALQPEPPAVAKAHPIYGYKVVSKEQARVKSLLPLFGDGKSSSSRDITSGVTFRAKGDSTWQTRRPNRNSDVCDMYMYRMPESRGGTPALSDDGDGGAVIKLCGVSLGSRPESPDPYPLFRCHTLPRKAPTSLRLSPPSPWPRAPPESPLTSPEPEVATSAPASPRFSEAPSVALQEEPHAAPGTPADAASRDDAPMPAGEKCSPCDGGKPPEEPPASATAPPRPPAPSFYQWCHTFTRSREASKGANHSPDGTASTAPTPWGIPGPPLRTTSRCAVAPRPYMGGLSSLTTPNAREGEEAASNPPTMPAGTQPPPPAGFSHATTCRADFQPPGPPGAVGQNASPGSAGEAGRPVPAVADRLARRSRQTTSQMTSADTSLAAPHPPPPDDSLSAAPILSPDVSPSVFSLMGSTDTPDRPIQPVERGPREGAPTTQEDRRATADLPVWLRIMKSSPSPQCSAPAQAALPHPPIRSSSKLEPFTPRIRNSGSVHNGANMPKTLPKNYSSPAGFTQAGNTQLYPTPKWLVADKTELCLSKLAGASQEAPAVTELSYGQKVPSQLVTTTTEPSSSQRVLSQEVAACTELKHKEKGFSQTVSATDNLSRSERESPQTSITTIEPLCRLKESSQTETVTADHCRSQKGPSQTMTSIPKLCHREPLQVVTTTTEPYCQREATQIINATAKPFYKEQRPTREPCSKQKLLSEKMATKNEPCHNRQMPSQALAITTEPFHEKEVPPLELAVLPPQMETSQIVVESVGPCQSQKALPQEVSVSAQPFLSQRGIPKAPATTVEIEPCSQKEISQAVTSSVERCRSQEESSQAMTTSEEFNRSREGAPLVDAAKLERSVGKIGLSQALAATTGPSQEVTSTLESPCKKMTSQAVTSTSESTKLQLSSDEREPLQSATVRAEPCYSLNGRPRQAVTASKEDCHKGPSLAGTAVKEDRIGPAREVTTIDEIFYKLIQPLQTVAVTDEFRLNQGGPPEAKTTTNETPHSQRTQAVGATPVITGECPPKCSTNDTQPSFTVSTSEMVPVLDLDTAHSHTPPPSLPPHHQEDNADVDEVFQSASSLCSAGFDKTGVVLPQQEDIPVCDEHRVSQDDERFGEGNSQRHSSACENAERAEEPDVTGYSSPGSSGALVEERSGGLSEDDNVTFRDKAVGDSVVGDGEAGEAPVAAGVPESAEGTDGGAVVGQGSCGVVAPRRTGTSERAAFTLPQPQDGGRAQRPRSMRFPLDVICGARLRHCRRGSDHSPSRVCRQRLSSVDQVHFLAPGPIHGGGSARSKSASRIGCGTADADAQPESQTREFGPCDLEGAGGASDAGSRDGGAKSPAMAPRSPVLPLDTALENKIRQTIDSFAGPKQSDGTTSWANGVGRSASDATTRGEVVNEMSPDSPNEGPEKEDTILAPNAEEMRVKGVITAEGFCLGVVEDSEEDVGVETLRGRYPCTPPPPGGSFGSQDSARRETSPATANDSVAQDMVGLTDATLHAGCSGTGVKGVLTLVVQDIEDQGILSCLQQQELQLGPREEQQQKEEEEFKVSEEGAQTYFHQLDETAPRQPSHSTDSSRATSPLPNYLQGLPYIDESESASYKSAPAHKVSVDMPADDQHTGEVECDLKKQQQQQVEEAPRCQVDSFGFPEWTQDSDEKCNKSTVESAPEEPDTAREEPESERGDCDGSEVILQPVCVLVVDAVAPPPGESGTHGVALVRVESVEEYEQAQEAMTPEPSHGFSQSSASVATVVRVDTPCDAHTRLPPEEEAEEEEFVDASDSMDHNKDDAEITEESHGGEHQAHGSSSPRLAEPVSVSGATPLGEGISRTLSATTSDTQSSGTSHTSSVDMCGTRFPRTVGDPSSSTSGSLSEPIGRDATQRPATAVRRRGSDMPEDGSTSSGSHVTDPDMLASASASSTGSETWWTSGGGSTGRRDLLPLDKDEEEAQWRALLTVNLPDTEEEPTGYESDEDFDTVDADMCRLEEKLRMFERELGESNEEESVPKNGEEASPPAIRSEDLQSLQISSLPRVFPTVSSAKTKHLSLMTRLEVQEYDDSASESGSESEAASSSDSADFLFVKTKIKLKPGDRKCRSLEEKRSKYYVLNKSSEDRRRPSHVKENPCVCEEQLDLSNLNVRLGTLDEEVVADDREETKEPSVPAQWAGGTTPPSRDDPGEECPAPGQPGDEREDIGGAMLCSGEEDDLLLGYIWHEEDGMASVDFEGLEDFKSFEGQGALMIMYEDDHDDRLHDEEASERSDALPSQTLGEHLIEESECESSWSRGSSCSASVSSPHQSSKGLEKNFLTAFKNSLRKASKYLGPKMESRSRKRDQSPDEVSSRHQHNDKLVESPQLPPDILYRGRRCSAGLDDDSSAGVYNVQSGRVAPVSTFIPTSDSEGPDAFSCSSGEYYAAPALCVNTSDEDPVFRGFRPRLQSPDLSHDTHRPAPHNHASDPSGPPPTPPPRWVQRRSYVPQSSGTALLDKRLSTSSEGQNRPAISAVMHPNLTPRHPNLPTTSQTVTHSPPASVAHVSAPLERFTNGKDAQLYLVGVANAAVAGGETREPVVAPGLSGCLAGDGEPLPPPPPQFTDDAPPGGVWLPHGYPHFTVPNHGNYSCVVPNQRLSKDEADFPVSHLHHTNDAHPSVPTHKPVSVKQLKRKQQDKILRQETEEGSETLGCTRCMGVPLMRGRPPEDASHWRQPSPHPKVIGDRRSWPPRVSCIVPLTRWSLPALACSRPTLPQTHATAGQPCLYFSRALMAAAGAAAAAYPHQCPANSHDPPHSVPSPPVCRSPARSADSQVSLGEEPCTDSTPRRTPGFTSSPGSDSDPYWTPIVCLGSKHCPQPPDCQAPATVTPSPPHPPPSTDLCPNLTSTHSWTPTMDITPYHYLYAQPSELTSEIWMPRVEHTLMNSTESHYPVLTSVLLPPVEEAPVPSYCWALPVDRHPTNQQEECDQCGDTHQADQEAPKTLSSHAYLPLSASTSVIRWPEAAVPLTLPVAAPLPTYSCPLLIFMSVLDLTGEHVTQEHVRDPTPGGRSPHPHPPSAHSRPPPRAAASTSSLEWDPLLKYSASESDVDSG